MGGIVSPSPSDVHVNRPLTNISVAYVQANDHFVSDRAFPMVSVAKQSDLYFTFPRGAFHRDNMQRRAPGTESSGATYDLETDSYQADVWALHKMVDDQTRANYDMPLSADREATVWLTQQAMIRKERLWAEQFLADSVWTFSADGAGSRSSSIDFSGSSNNDLQYWNQTNATPIEDVRLLKLTVLRETGFEPNVLVLGMPVYNALLDHPDIIERVKYGQTPGSPAMANRQVLASIFELDEVLVMKGVFNNAIQGASDNQQFIGGKNGLLLYRNSMPGLMMPSAGYTFGWTGYVGAGDMGMRIMRMRMDTHRSDRIEIEMAFDYKRVSADLGVFLDDIVQ